MKTNTLIFLFFLTFSNLSAQTDSSFTLQQCIDYALKNSTLVLNAELDDQMAGSKVKETKALGYPQITAGASLIDNPQLQRMFLRNSPESFFPPYNPNEPDVLAIKNIFQLRSSGDVNMQLNQLLFDGSYIVGLQAAKSYRELSQKSLKLAKIQTVENVTKAYYAILIAEESKKMFDINISRLDTSLSQLKIMYQTGLVEDIDVKRLEVQYNNLLTDQQNTNNLLALGELGLKLSMGMPLDEPLALADSINSFEINPSPIRIESFDATKRIEYSLTQSQEKLAMLDYKRLKFSRLPTLVAFAKGGASRSDIRFINLFKNDWYGYSMVGLNLSIPILDFRRHYQIDQSRYTTQKVKNNLTNYENVFKMEAANARLSFNNSIQTMQNQKRNMELAQEVARVSKIKYQEGVGANLEVVNAEADLQTAQINYYRALYDAMIAKINYEKATGKLYNE